MLALPWSFCIIRTRRLPRKRGCHVCHWIDYCWNPYSCGSWRGGVPRQLGAGGYNGVPKALHCGPKCRRNLALCATKS